MSDSQLHEQFCACTIQHPDAIEKAREGSVDEDLIQMLADFFKLFSDPTRLRILKALGITELCVCDLSQLLEMSQSAISHQLAILRRSRIVKPRREGKTVYYSLDDEHVSDVLRLSIEHMEEKR